MDIKESSSASEGTKGSEHVTGERQVEEEPLSKRSQYLMIFKSVYPDVKKCSN
jgi:hypothetical protein